MYYLKAQDLLIELSEQFPNDYRIWWELSKPLDFQCEEAGNDGEDRFKFNEEYFSKALDAADVSVKKDLIRQCEAYEKKKEAIKAAIKAKIEEQRKEEERLAREKKEEEERLERKKKEEEERLAREKLELERKTKEKEEKRRSAEIERKRWIEDCTVRGVVYPTVEQAKQAEWEHGVLDDLKNQLSRIKSQKKRQEVFAQFDTKLTIANVQERYRLLANKINVEEPVSVRANKIYGITVIITLIIALALFGSVPKIEENIIFLTFAMWGSFGIYIWPIWKLVQVLKRMSPNHYMNLKNI